MKRLSGDQKKGCPLFSVPGTERASSESSGRTQIVAPALKASMRPSGEMLIWVPRYAFAGGAIWKRMEVAGSGGFCLK
jgi:hypothetical protein